MKRAYAPCLILLPAALLPGCAPRPANSNAVARGAIDNVNVVTLGLDPTRANLVRVDRQRRVFFKDEQVGTLDAPGPLKEKVQQAIEKRRQEESAAAGNNRETAAHANTVFFCAPADFKYGDVAPVIDAIKEVGGNPVGLTGCDPPR